MAGRNIEELEAQLRKLAARPLPHEEEDFNPYEYSGGNFDDAYWTGEEAGETTLAKFLLAKFFPSA